VDIGRESALDMTYEWIRNTQYTTELGLTRLVSVSGASN
jgi:hypothetical protein